MSIVITIFFCYFNKKNHTFQVALDLFRAPKLNLLNCFKKNWTNFLWKVYFIGLAVFFLLLFNNFFIIVYVRVCFYVHILITYFKSIHEYYFAKQSIILNLSKSSLQNRHHQQYLHRWTHHKKSQTKSIDPQLHHPFEHDAHLRYRAQQNPIQGVPQHQSIQFQMTQMKCRCVSFVKYLELLKIWLSK